MGVRGCGLPGLRAVRIGRNAPTGMASPTSRQGHGYRCLRCRRVIHLSFLLGRLGGFAEDCFSSRRFDALAGSTECTAHGEPTTGDQPGAPRPRIEAIRWAEFAGLFRNTRQAFLEHERSKAELKALMPEDAKEAIGHGIRAKRAIIGSALGASLRAGRALSDQLEPQLAANEGRSALKGFDGNVALRLQDAIHLGAAGVHAFGESRLRHALALHFLCELPGDDARHRLSLRGFADTVLAQKRIERRAPMGILFGHAFISFIRLRAISKSSAGELTLRRGDT